MHDNYYVRFGLEYNPFIKNQNKEFIETEETKEVSTRLDYLISTRGIGVIIGEPGLGKTTILRHKLNSLNKAQYKVIYESLSSVTLLEFYRNLSRDLGMESKARKSDNFKLIQEGIKNYYDDKKMVPIIVIDEAHMLVGSIINDLKIIFNFNMDSKDKAVIILCGTSRLKSLLNLSAHDDLRQRIIVNFSMEALSDQDARKYITEKFEKAGGNTSIFQEGTLKAIISGCGGNIRRMDRIIDIAMLIADRNNESVLSSKTIEDAFMEVSM